MTSLAQPNAVPDKSPTVPVVSAGHTGLWILFALLGLLLLFVAGLVVAGAVFLFLFSARPRPVTQPTDSTPPLPAGWKTVRYAAGRYSVALPENIVDSSGSKPGSMVHGYAPDGCAATVTYFDFSERVKFERERLMQSTVEGRVKGLEGRETSRSDVWALGVSGIEVRFEGKYDGADCGGRMRVFENRGRVYVLSWITPATATGGSASDLFFDSFQIEHASALTGPAPPAKGNARLRPGSPTFTAQ